MKKTLLEEQLSVTVDTCTRGQCIILTFERPLCTRASLSIPCVSRLMLPSTSGRWSYLAEGGGGRGERKEEEGGRRKEKGQRRGWRRKRREEGGGRREEESERREESKE